MSETKRTDDNDATRDDGRGTLLIVGLLIILLVLAGYGAKPWFDNKSAAPRKPPKISLIPTTPPPPPPPPKEEKRPEPPKEVKEVRVQPEPKNEPPPDQSLKMEGAAGDAPSAFAGGKVVSEDMGKIGNPGVIGGTGGAPVVARGTVLDPFNTYASAVKGELQRNLARRAELKRRRYGVEINLWVADDGRLTRFELLGSSNDDDTDAAIRTALAALGSFSEAPPPKMPQPLRLRIVAGGRA